MKNHLITNDLIRQILQQAIDDWVSYSEIRGFVDEDACNNGRSVSDREFIQILHYLIQADVISPGDVTSDRGFSRWSGDVESQVERIAQASAGRADFAPGDICWFDIRPKGLDMLRQLGTGS